MSTGALFRAPPPRGRALYALGTAAAAGHGVAMPLFGLFFGELIHAGNGADAAATPADALSATAAVAWRLLLLGAVAGGLAGAQVVCFRTAVTQTSACLRRRAMDSLRMLLARCHRSL